MNKKDFKKLQDEWYKKAKESGFKDIETTLPDGSSSNLTKSAIGAQGRKYTEAYIEAGQTYYSNASKFLWDNDWSNEIERKIWELHANGRSYRFIREALQPVKRMGLETITNIVNNLKTQMTAYIKKENEEYSAEVDAAIDSYVNKAFKKEQ
jgi:hypothetical protein